MPPIPADAQKTPGNRIERRLLVSLAALAAATLIVLWSAMRFVGVEIPGAVNTDVNVSGMAAEIAQESRFGLFGLIILSGLI